jgi:phage-related protein
MAARRNQNPSVLRNRTAGDGLAATTLATGRESWLPHSRPMPSIGVRCHELRVRDQTKNWRIIYRIDDDAIVIAEVFNKTTRTMPAGVLATCQRRLRLYDSSL